MFRKRAEGKAQSRRDEEWRALVRTITDPDASASEADEARFRAYLRELGRADPRAQAPAPADAQTPAPPQA